MPSLVGIGPAEALSLCDTLQTHTDTMRGALSRIGDKVLDLQSHNYISDTMDAFQGKYESESKPQLEKVFNTADAAVQGTREVVRVQLERQAQGANAVQKV